MLPQQRRKSTKKRIRFPGIGMAALILGVTRVHLYRVLTGERDGRDGLRQRARAIMKTKGAAK